jgi:hypothetical protein
MDVRTALVVLVLLVPAEAIAQQTAPSPPDANPDAQFDLFDARRHIRNKPSADEPPDARGLMFAAAPIMGNNPTFGVTFGAAAQLAFISGSPRTTRVSSAIASVSYSTKDQMLVNNNPRERTSAWTWDSARTARKACIRRLRTRSDRRAASAM